MKVLLKKLKKTKLSIRLIYYFILFIFLIGYVWLFRNLLLLSGIETTLRVIALVVLGLLYLAYSFGDLLMLLTKKYKTVVFTSIIMLLLSAIMIIGSLAIGKVYGLIGNMNKSTIVYTTNLITMNKTEFKNNSNFNVGIINNETDVEGNVLAYELIKKNKLNVSLKKYDTYFEMLEKLYNGELDGLFITSNYVTMYEGYEAYENIKDDVKVIYEYSKKMKNQDFIESSGSVDKPFTVLLMGVDSKKDGLNANAAFNGDTLMVISFNPNTLSATVFSIPRDTYVPIACIKGSSKINSAAAYGTECVINTVQNLIGINIDYYVKVNFKGVVDLVDALGGIEVDVVKPDFNKNGKLDCKGTVCEQNSNRQKGDNTIYVPVGKSKLNGEQALAYARNRHQYAAGDFARVEHQQQVVEGVANAAKNLKNINDFYAVLDAVSKNMDTNMTTSEMMNLYNVGKNALLNANDGQLINIQKTYLTGYDLTMLVDNLRSRVYTFQYYPQSLEEIVDALKVTLELKKPEIIKTFNFSVNEEYKVPIIGKKYYTIQRNETIPEFKGKNLTYVQEWCKARNLTVNVTYVKKGMNGYDDSLGNGYVLSQTVKRGTLTSKVTSVGVSVISKESIQNVTTTTTKAVDKTTTSVVSSSTTLSTTVSTTATSVTTIASEDGE